MQPLGGERTSPRSLCFCPLCSKKRNVPCPVLARYHLWLGRVMLSIAPLRALGSRIFLHWSVSFLCLWILFYFYASMRSFSGGTSLMIIYFSRIFYEEKLNPHNGCNEKFADHYIIYSLIRDGHVCQSLPIESLLTSWPVIFIAKNTAYFYSSKRFSSNFRCTEQQVLTYQDMTVHCRVRKRVKHNRYHSPPLEKKLNLWGRRRTCVHLLTIVHCSILDDYPTITIFKDC